MPDAREFGIAHLTAARLERGVHAVRFLRRYHVVDGAVEDPHRQRAKVFGYPGVRIGDAVGDAAHAQAVVVVGMADAAADDRGGGEHAGVIYGNLPCAVAAHRQASEI